LRTYPSVQRAVAEGRLQLSGWFFDLKRAKVTVWDESQRRFVEAGEQIRTLARADRVPA
jgi:carbonic anhydrase